MKSFFTLICLLFVSVGVVAQGRDVVLKTSTGDIYGSIMTPVGDNRDVVALLICGSGPTDRDGNNPQMKNNSIKYLAEDLCRGGIASFRYDKRAIAKSASEATSEADLRFSHYVEDARGWIEMLSKKYKKVVVVGHSEGALIGAMASKGNAHVSAFVSIAGVGSSADKILKKQLAAQSPMVTSVAFPIIDSLIKGQMVVDVPPMLNVLFRQSVQPYLISWFVIDPAVEIAKVTTPVLIIQGDKDIQVQVEDAQMLAKAQPRAKMVIVPNMNHVLKVCDSTNPQVQMKSYADPSVRNAEKLAQEIIGFVKLNVR